MPFNSYAFYCLLCFVVCLFYLSPSKYRWVVLLCASYCFYLFLAYRFFIFLLFSSLVGFFTGWLIQRADSQRKKYPWLFACVVTQICLILSFKYTSLFDFSSDSAFSVSWRLGISLPDILWPVGLSFFTLQIISYSVDIYRGKHRPREHLGHFLLYVSFFPKIISGPIERASSLIPQFTRNTTLNSVNILTGAQQIVWGIFKKAVVADRLAHIVDAVYSSPAEHSGITLLWPLT